MYEVVVGETPEELSGKIKQLMDNCIVFSLIGGLTVCRGMFYQAVTHSPVQNGTGQR